MQTIYITIENDRLDIINNLAAKIKTDVNILISALISYSTLNIEDDEGEFIYLLGIIKQMEISAKVEKENGNEKDM